MLLKWKTQHGKYVDTELGCLGKICVFKVWYNSVSREKSNYILSPRLPGFKHDEYYSDDENKLKLELAEQLLSDWLEAAGLVTK